MTEEERAVCIQLHHDGATIEKLADFFDADEATIRETVKPVKLSHRDTSAQMIGTIINVYRSR